MVHWYTIFEGATALLHTTITTQSAQNSTGIQGASVEVSFEEPSKLFSMDTTLTYTTGHQCQV